MILKVYALCMILWLSLVLAACAFPGFKRFLFFVPRPKKGEV